MSFLFRVLLVVGVLTYLAARQIDGSHSTLVTDVGADVQASAKALRSKIADTVSEAITPMQGSGASRDVRAAGLREAPARLLDRLMRDAADGHILQAKDALLSRDTLSDADRRPAWRGTPRP